MNQQRKKSLLVVEDDAELCAQIMDTAQKHGYLAAGVVNIRDAVFKLKNQKYSCVVLDICLNGDNGVDLIEFLRGSTETLNHGTPILVVSGALDVNLVQKIRPGIQGALVKPFNTGAFLEQLERLTNREDFRT